MGIVIASKYKKFSKSLGMKEIAVVTGVDTDTVTEFSSSSLTATAAVTSDQPYWLELHTRESTFSKYVVELNQLPSELAIHSILSNARRYLARLSRGVVSSEGMACVFDNKSFTYGEFKEHKKSVKGDWLQAADMRNARDTLVTAGLLTFESGSQSSGKCSRLVPTSALIYLYLGFISVPSRTESIRTLFPNLLPNLTTVEVSVEGSERYTLQESEAAESLHALNIANLKHTWTLEGVPEDIDYGDIGERVDGRITLPVKELIYKRVFNSDDLSEGGRFYAPIISIIPRHHRRFIRIGGSTLTELDFSSIHTRIAYELSGLTPPTDCYNLDDDSPRPLVKAAMLLIHNWKSSNLAGFHMTLRKAMNREYNKRLKAKKLTDSPIDVSMYNPDNYSNEQINTVITRIKEVHAPIKAFLFAEKGRILQNWDSRIAEEVINLMTDIPILLIHDGFLVPHQHIDTLRAAMVSAYQTILKTKNTPQIS